jgi:hypothetical protein
LLKQCEAELKRVFRNRIAFEDLPPVNTVSERVLVTGFWLLPIPTTDEHHETFAKAVCEVLAKRLLERDRGEDGADRLDYALRHRFFDKLAHIVLQSDKGDIAAYLQPFLEHFSGSRESAALLSSFVSAEDKLHQYDRFWAAWELFRALRRCANTRQDGFMAQRSCTTTYLRGLTGEKA